MVTLEESSLTGGLGSLVGELLADAGVGTPLKRLAAPDRHLYRYGPREWLHAQFGLDVDNVLATILRWLSSR